MPLYGRRVDSLIGTDDIVKMTLPVEGLVSQELPLWKTDVPFFAGSTPTMSVYAPKKPSGGAVLICPGGGYGDRATHEGAVVGQ